MMSLARIEELYGRREGDALYDACEFGYHCPEGHYPTTWSEFNNHIWCPECKKDYHSTTCPIQRPSWMSDEEFRKFLTQLPFTPKILEGRCKVPA